MTNIYVGNLPYSTTDATLQETFESFGAVDRAKVIMDRISGRPRGFGFIEMSNSDEAQAAIEALNGSELDGRTLVVNEARPKS
ncbi:MAG: RNA-binding protein [Actinobacteria bacterium]|nr:RNA-binding protein [Actinomycetota bacterium]